jgi:hypothetical protein
MLKVNYISRKLPPKGAPEVPFETPRGFKMADPTIGPNRHIAKHSIYVATLEEVAEKLARGLSLWMKQAEKRETLIKHSSLQIVWKS